MLLQQPWLGEMGRNEMDEGPREMSRWSVGWYRSVVGQGSSSRARTTSYVTLLAGVKEVVADKEAAYLEYLGAESSGCAGVTGWYGEGCIRRIGQCSGLLCR
jgi:hypothetical protein